MVLYFFVKYEPLSLHITCMSEGMKIHRLWTVLAKKTDVKFNGAILFIVIITLCGQYRCYLYIHLLMSVSSDQTTYYSSLFI